VSGQRLPLKHSIRIKRLAMTTRSRFTADEVLSALHAAEVMTTALTAENAALRESNAKLLHGATEDVRVIEAMMGERDEAKAELQSALHRESLLSDLSRGLQEVLTDSLQEIEAFRLTHVVNQDELTKLRDELSARTAERNEARKERDDLLISSVAKQRIIDHLNSLLDLWPASFLGVCQDRDKLKHENRELKSELAALRSQRREDGELLDRATAAIQLALEAKSRMGYVSQFDDWDGPTEKLRSVLDAIRSARAAAEKPPES
jgi:chromosome segregation ATPase